MGGGGALTLCFIGDYQGVSRVVDVTRASWVCRARLAVSTL